MNLNKVYVNKYYIALLLRLHSKLLELIVAFARKFCEFSRLLGIVREISKTKTYDMTPNHDRPWKCTEIIMKIMKKLFFHGKELINILR